MLNSNILQHQWCASLLSFKIQLLVILFSMVTYSGFNWSGRVRMAPQAWMIAVLSYAKLVSEFACLNNSFSRFSISFLSNWMNKPSDLGYKAKAGDFTYHLASPASQACGGPTQSGAWLPNATLLIYSLMYIRPMWLVWSCTTNQPSCENIINIFRKWCTSILWCCWSTRYVSELLWQRQHGCSWYCWWCGDGWEGRW